MNFPSHDVSWLGRNSGDEPFIETAARGGSLSEEGRRAAIGSAMKLVGQYFASGEQPLTSQRAVSYRDEPSNDSSLSTLLAGIRLRVALAAAVRLRKILSRVSDHATFRYQLQSVDSAGALTGQLDINRYVTQLGTYGAVPTYPILEVRRAEQTPENILAVYATRWLLRELRTAFTASDARRDSPEFSQYKSARRELENMLRLPGLTGCVPLAKRIGLRHAEQQLVDVVKRRLRRREIPNATPYADLVNWVSHTLNGSPAAEPGDIDWSFYGDRFDTKLFELWCLNLLGQEVSRQLAVNEPRVGLGWRTGAATYTWNQLGGTLSLHFQRSPATISTAHNARWQRMDDHGKTLGGIPDIVAHAVRREDGEERLLVVDPKLRQRTGPPTEELYKILGYLDNFDIAGEPRGSVLYYTTDKQKLSQFAYTPSNGRGVLLAVGMNPAAPEQSQRALASVVTAILGLLDLPPLNAPEQFDNDDTASPEQTAEMHVRARVKEFAVVADHLPKSVLETSRRRVCALIGESCWQAVPEKVGTMLATADHIGFSLTSDGDFSGPTIGICASVESILHEYAITPATAHDPDLAKKCESMTLGKTIVMIEQAIQGIQKPQPEHVALAAHFSTHIIDFDAVMQLIKPLRNMNQRYRIPAAHRDSLTESAWRATWATVIGPNALLAQTIKTLVPIPSTY